MRVLTKTETSDLFDVYLAIFEANIETGIITFASRPLELMFGYTLTGDLTGKPIEILVPDAKKDAHAKIHRPMYYADPEPRMMGRKLPLTGQKKDGTLLPVEVMLLPRAVMNQRIVVGIVFDMTGRS